jgi:hypothetical protein
MWLDFDEDRELAATSKDRSLAGTAMIPQAVSCIFCARVCFDPQDVQSHAHLVSLPHSRAALLQYPAELLRECVLIRRLTEYAN